MSLSEVALKSRAQQGPNAISSQESTIQVLVGDELLLQETIQWQESTVESLVFDELTLPPGQHPRLTVRLTEDDALLEDNEVTMVVQQPQPTPVALLKARSGDYPQASVFLSTAMETETLAAIQTVVGTAEMASSDYTHLIAGRDLQLQATDLDLLQFVDANRNALVFDQSQVLATDVVSVRGLDIGWYDETHPLALGAIDWMGAQFYDTKPIPLQDNDRVLLETINNLPLTRGKEHHTRHFTVAKRSP